MSKKLKKCKDCGAEISKSAETCPQCGKKQNKPIIKKTMILIIALLIIVAIAGANQSEKKENLVLVSSEMNYDGYSTTYIEGTIENKSDKEYSYAQVTFNLFDAEGNQLGTAVANINNLQPNASWKYKAIGLTTQKVERFELQEITGW